jgi:cytochrome c556
MLSALCIPVSLAAACTQPSAADKGKPAAADEPAPAPTARHAMGQDTRTPLPLTAMMANHQKQEMRDHLRVIQEITVALGQDDFDAILASASRITWSDQQAAMCEHMGAGAPGFADRGEQFHRTADGIAEAARRRDHAGVEVAVGATLATCVGCHETYRQEIVDDDTFTAAGGSADCPMHGQ